MKILFTRITLLFVFAVIILGLSNSNQALKLEPLYISNPVYAGSSIEAYTGDVLYTSKGWSTGLVGHVGIVGTDFNIKEVLAESPAGESRSFTSFWNRTVRVMFLPYIGQ